MGDRGVVQIADTGVVLYTHWGATALPRTVAGALGREERWRDAPYLARIIFSEMIRGRLDEPTGFGILTQPPADAWRVIRINCADRSVEFVAGGGYFEDREVGVSYSFEAFVDEFGPEREAPTP